MNQLHLWIPHTSHWGFKIPKYTNERQQTDNLTIYSNTKPTKPTIPTIPTKKPKIKNIVFVCHCSNILPSPAVDCNQSEYPVPLSEVVNPWPMRVLTRLSGRVEERELRLGDLWVGDCDWDQRKHHHCTCKMIQPFWVRVRYGMTFFEEKTVLNIRY